MAWLTYSWSGQATIPCTAKAIGEVNTAVFSKTVVALFKLESNLVARSRIVTHSVLWPVVEMDNLIVVHQLWEKPKIASHECDSAVIIR